MPLRANLSPRSLSQQFLAGLQDACGDYLLDRQQALAQLGALVSECAPNAFDPSLEALSPKKGS